MHPYWGQDFWSFFTVLCSRVLLFCRGELALNHLSADEMQILVLGSLGVVMSFIGSFLVYRRMTMLANSISHTILLGIVVTTICSGWLLGTPGEKTLHLTPLILLVASAVTSFLTTLSTQFFIRVLRVQKDASIGLVFTAFLALGIVLVTVFTRNSHVGTELILGNIDLLSGTDVSLSLWVAFFLSIILFGCYRPLLISTFDAGFSRSLGVSARGYDQLLMFLTSASVICAFRVVGVALVLALLVLPPMIARFFTHRFGWVILGGIIVNTLASLIAVALARHYLSVYDVPLSTTGIMVTLLFLLYLSSAVIKLTIPHFRATFLRTRAGEKA